LLESVPAVIRLVMLFRKDDQRFMRAALAEARKGLGRTSPNPAVGAILVVRNEIIARGHHRRAGAPHAEIECLRHVAGALPVGATLYLTLEPCSTTGRTGPCTDEIVRAGIQTVVLGAIDVNPRHRGRAITLLEKAGIEVRAGVLADECMALNEAFNKWIVTGRPFVIAKCGMSLDGKLSKPDGEPRWITGMGARHHARKLRAYVDAIIVGAETVRRDNPRLTVRGVPGAKQPWRVVLTRSGNLPSQARLFRDGFRERTLVYRRKSLDTVLRELGQKDVTSVLIEGGGEILSEALDSALIDKVHIYLGPILTGGPVIAFGGQGVPDKVNAAHLERISCAKVGHTISITGYPVFRLREAAGE
jgi:diaminohydroxyphosphoribosylaminopyrimidine deaminase/5-amino-6-(5-phosphoribosylamino)uracil reductase